MKLFGLFITNAKRHAEYRAMVRYLIVTQRRQLRVTRSRLTCLRDQLRREEQLHIDAEQLHTAAEARSLADIKVLNRQVFDLSETLDRLRGRKGRS